MRLLYVLLIGIILFTACKSEQGRAKAVEGEKQASNVKIETHNIVVKEVVQTSQYTYLEVTEDDKDFWIAVSKVDVKKGAKLQFDDYLEMKDFESKELNKVFDRILFVQTIKGEAVSKIASVHGAMGMESGMMKKPNAKMQDVKVDKAPDGITIAELFKNRNDYKDKIVTIRGKVVKVNRNILNLNWIHIQDGTKDGENFDLTLTSDDDAHVGDIITIKGKVVLNKDFGAGYSYDLIVQEAIIK